MSEQQHAPLGQEQEAAIRSRVARVLTPGTYDIDAAVSLASINVPQLLAEIDRLRATLDEAERGRSEWREAGWRSFCGAYCDAPCTGAPRGCHAPDRVST